uniref:Uncharacterized protein n=1 Tax=Ditylenchus dipsaci TaxID=166011 RepID=A0A915CX17_9BILA
MSVGHTWSDDEERSLLFFARGLLFAASKLTVSMDDAARFKEICGFADKISPLQILLKIRAIFDKKVELGIFYGGNRDKMIDEDVEKFQNYCYWAKEVPTDELKQKAREQVNE